MISSKISIGLVACYIGKLPWYFVYFVHSCSYNPDIDFFIITDDESYDSPVPSNLKIIRQDIKEIRAIVSSKLQLEVALFNGYKLCDFKPAYGIIFSDYLEGYDFWGHTDIDIIFGQIRDFISDELLTTHDLISVRPDWLTGCFLLYKNVPHINRLFMQSKDYIRVFTSREHFCFDETNFAHDAFSAGKMFYEVNTDIESMMHVVQRAAANHQIKPFFDLFIIEGTPGRLHWRNGKLYYRNRFEILLYHLIYFKKQDPPSRAPQFTTAGFSIGPSKIRHHKTPLFCNEV
ncbi:hypothetical protein DIU31_021645 [Mucilaginibacter rubeus]|uniref:Uncharacterized protein n=1 Tax=Mucilaginibacter rubeus TaxID=2027860 RepID=A0AAE6JJC9_9SPHI|nr:MULTISPECIES: DUF6625 family protein [Mucilaginibacter]QEM05985.1 hypothetical protein DIU31_021645 [Mucilaginibacter rubeus]QEM18565.1 hypothetical protein DIU38_021860 [Mucilaginibacter gossypii]QTE44893.1 hypothetical protein J3L19_05855 [Mucilaginibacter rubeus]QTE51491.1 hypothetical protein J3L21_05830 [Mucilaginibacter rubeus]QTE56577.1 hypothetical protein J3L23_31075 [Mucilaginibacter rubeus]